MASGYINKERKIFADDVNNPHILGVGGVTDIMAEHVADIVEDNADEIFSKPETETAINNIVSNNVEEWTFTLDNDTTVIKKVVVYD